MEPLCRIILKMKLRLWGLSWLFRREKKEQKKESHLTGIVPMSVVDKRAIWRYNNVERFVTCEGMSWSQGSFNDRTVLKTTRQCGRDAEPHRWRIRVIVYCLRTSRLGGSRRRRLGDSFLGLSEMLFIDSPYPPAFLLKKSVIFCYWIYRLISILPKILPATA